MHNRFEVEVQQSQLIAPDSDLYLILERPITDPSDRVENSRRRYF